MSRVKVPIKHTVRAAKLKTWWPVLKKVKHKILTLNEQTGGETSSILSVIRGVLNKPIYWRSNAAIEAARAGEQDSGFCCRCRWSSQPSPHERLKLRVILNRSFTNSSRRWGLTSADRVCAQAHPKLNRYWCPVSRYEDRVVEERWNKCSLMLKNIQQQTQSTTLATKGHSTQSQTITSHANDTSLSAGETRDK